MCLSDLYDSDQPSQWVVSVCVCVVASHYLFLSGSLGQILFEVFMFLSGVPFSVVVSDTTEHVILWPGVEYILEAHRWVNTMDSVRIRQEGRHLGAHQTSTGICYLVTLYRSRNQIRKILKNCLLTTSGGGKKGTTDLVKTQKYTVLSMVGLNSPEWTLDMFQMVTGFTLTCLICE